MTKGRSGAFVRMLVMGMLCGFLGGCASTTTQPGIDPAMVRLAEAAEVISQRMTTLALVESAQSDAAHSARQYEFDTDAMPEAWGRPLVLAENYYGTIEDFIQIMSALLGMKEPRILGNKPANPVMVALNRGDRPAIEILADAGFQAGERVLVRPMIEDERIMLKYR